MGIRQSGRSTTDPAVAIEGLLAPIGGFKGTVFAFIMGILSSMLSDAAYGLELGNMIDGPIPDLDGHFVLAIKVDAFEEVARFKKRVDKAIQEIHACRPVAGVDRIYVPRELEALRRKACYQNSIPLNNVTLTDLRQVAQQIGCFYRHRMRNRMSKKPNIIVILADDMGFGDVGCYDPVFCKVPTPNIDRLAHEGVMFTDAHTSLSPFQPLALRTADWALCMMAHLFAGGCFASLRSPLIAPNRLTVPTLLRENGYRTACIGKWHLGWKWPQRENEYVYRSANHL